MSCIDDNIPLIFLETDIFDFMDELYPNDSVMTTPQRGRRFSSPKKTVEILRRLIKDPVLFRNSMYNLGWSERVREYFPEFEDIIGFKL